MCAGGKIASCQVSFIPIGSLDYSREIQKAIKLIEDSGLHHDIGVMSTVVVGEKDAVLGLVADLYHAMDDVCDFTMDVRLSNVCGCGK
ncbi:MAG TPA: YkoF family thiamine/hydroxymethylpyrimidine-binding protein [Clostridia bacterium]|nr:YkoF family thiamine/hydroxymethylpyrimidine-binding protein [Clostridia bacterium]